MLDRRRGGGGVIDELYVRGQVGANTAVGRERNLVEKTGTGGAGHTGEVGVRECGCTAIFISHIAPAPASVVTVGVRLTRHLECCSLCQTRRQYNHHTTRVQSWCRGTMTSWSARPLIISEAEMVDSPRKLRAGQRRYKLSCRLGSNLASTTCFRDRLKNRRGIRARSCRSKLPLKNAFVAHLMGQI